MIGCAAKVKKSLKNIKPLLSLALAAKKQGTPNVKSPLEALPAQLGELMLRDQQRLRRRLQGARKIKNPDAQLAVAAEVESDIAAARQKCRRAPRLARALPIRKACRSAKKSRTF